MKFQYYRFSFNFIKENRNSAFENRSLADSLNYVLKFIRRGKNAVIRKMKIVPNSIDALTHFYIFTILQLLYLMHVLIIHDC